MSHLVIVRLLYITQYLARCLDNGTDNTFPMVTTLNGSFLKERVIPAFIIHSAILLYQTWRFNDDRDLLGPADSNIQPVTVSTKAEALGLPARKSLCEPIRGEALYRYELI
ncbi:hypothetical protein N7519_005330 [Penicillium mononematosum]|uniref:uncharacterized protein n=1 Tax=Penicillium mononematosum TaxID=268346 RepID=UPI002546FB87|nr:uncharacterized protein N7519_005330 [Penicillium mononematosum]KAJ6184029.1 hypothetical protein N7519_005330 [Penicillium mononematosum]